MYQDNNENINNTPEENGTQINSHERETAKTHEGESHAQINAAAEAARQAQAAEAARQAQAAQNAQNLHRSEYSGAGVGRTYDPSARTQSSGYSYGSYYSAPQPPKAEDKTKKQKARPSIAYTAILCVFCILLGACSGFGGAYAYKYFFDSEDGATNKGGQVIINQSTIESSGETQEGSLTEVISNISQTVVEIRTEKVSYGMFLGNYVSEGAGSGVIISADGYIITNNHVIEGADTLTVRTKAGDEYEATLIGTDAQTDIAVIKIEATGLPAATVGTSADLLVGQRAIAIGNPLGELGGTVTIGYISALDRVVSIDNVDMNLLQTDAAINPGNSGGGLFDTDGRLIGIVNAKSSGEDIEGLGFSIPIDTAIAIATDLIEIGHVSGRPGLGIRASEVNTSNYSQYRGTELNKYIDNYGVYIVEDERNNFEFGDRIVALDDTTISTQADLSSAISKHEIGDTVTVTVSRNRKLIEIEVELIELDA